MIYGAVCFASTGMEGIAPDHFKDVFLMLIGVMIVGLQVWQAVRSRKTEVGPNPLQIQTLDKFATRDFCNNQHQEIQRRLTEHDIEIRAIREEAKKDRAEAEVHASMRSKTIFDSMSSLRRELNDKIDTMPERIITLLSNMGVLKKPD
jgi:hypothetical protein